ncbi:RNA-directed DNA polymerase, eukaryota [Tanacetum coccineum]
MTLYSTLPRKEHERIKGEGSTVILEERMSIVSKLTDLDNIDSLALAQKAKIKWSIKGDENTNFFHGIINKQRNNLSIHGILVDGAWIEDPIAVKNEFLNHFRDRFNSPCLRINMHKIKIMGVAVENSKTVCRELKPDMRSLISFFVDFSKWKLKTLSIEARLTLLKSEENWKEDIPFKLLFPRIYALELDKHISVASKLSQPDLDVSFRRKPRGRAEQDQMYAMRLKIEDHILSNSIDRWYWSLTCSGEFSVASIRNFIDDQSFKVFSPSTRWNKAAPKKINIMAWKVKMTNLPTRFNLSRRGLNIESILCPICNLAAETSCHLFFKCCMVKDIYKKIESWWDINMVSTSSYEEWCIWFSPLRLSSKAKLFLEGVFFITWWSIWRYRNKIIFGSSSHPKSRIMDDIMASSFSWCRFRCNSNFSWVDWLKNPSIISL